MDTTELVNRTMDKAVSLFTFYVRNNDGTVDTVYDVVTYYVEWRPEIVRCNVYKGDNAVSFVNGTSLASVWDRSKEFDNRQDALAFVIEQTGFANVVNNDGLVGYWDRTK